MTVLVPKVWPNSFRSFFRHQLVVAGLLDVKKLTATMLLVAFYCGFGSSLHAGVVVYSSGGYPIVAVGASDSNGSTQPFINGYSATLENSIPLHRPLDYNDGAAHALAVADFSVAGQETVFDFSFALNRTGNIRSYANLYGRMRIMSDTDTNYVISGLFDSNSISSSELAYFSSILTEKDSINGDTVVSESTQRSESTSAETFSLGGSGGDTLNDLTGSLFGTLKAGVEYVWEYYASIEEQGLNGPSVGAEASGGIRLVLGGDLPEATTVTASTTVDSGTLVEVNGYDASSPTPGGVRVEFSDVSENNQPLDISYSTVDPSLVDRLSSFTIPGTLLQSWDFDFGAELAGPALISFAYDEDLLGAGVDENNLSVFHTFGDGSGSELLQPISIDTVNNILTLEVDKFSTFDLVLSSPSTTAVVPEPASCLTFAALALCVTVSRRGRGRFRQRK
ncbi:MAG: hypothetical protein KDB00_29350 [Planctomycetales bacterium]|nr:hypothetical protein [Planctomycetales bacterium]